MYDKRLNYPLRFAAGTLGRHLSRMQEVSTVSPLVRKIDSSQNRSRLSFSGHRCHQRRGHWHIPGASLELADPRRLGLSYVAFEAKFLHNATKGRLRNDQSHVLDEGNEVVWCHMSMLTKSLTHKSEVILGEPGGTSKTRGWQIGFGMCSYISTNSALAATNDAADSTVRVGCSSLRYLAPLDQCESGTTHFQVMVF